MEQFPCECIGPGAVECWEPSAESPGAEGLPYLEWSVQNHPGGSAKTALLRLYEQRAGSEHLLMWQDTFSFECKMSLQTLHCAELQDGLNPEMNVPVEVRAAFDLFRPFSWVYLIHFTLFPYVIQRNKLQFLL